MTTTTPIGASVPAVDQGISGSTGSSCGGDVFLALVQGLLDAQPAPAPATPASTTSSDAGERAPGEATASETDTPAADPAVLDPMAPSPFVPTIVASLVASVAPSLVAPPVDGTQTQPKAAVETTGAGIAATVPGATESTTPTAGPAGPADPAAPPAPGAPGTPGAAAPRPERAEPAPSVLAPAPTTEAGQAPEQPASGAQPSGTQPTANPAPAAGSTSNPTVGGAVAPTAPPAVGTAPAAPLSPVARQVFPEVVKLTTSTEGPQRVTIRLNPESLGEVRVVLTERRGALEVSLSGGSEARRALLDGTPELQRLLDAVGRGDSRIVVRDAAGLPVTASPAAASAGPSSAQPGATWSSDLSGGAWTGAGRSGGDAAADQGRHPTPGSSNATDGTPAATNRSRTTETVTGARPGLDVTM